MVNKKKDIFQDWYTNLMRLYHDESHIANGTMSPKNYTLNWFNEFIDHYIENMMQKPCFGICINESAPYGLASKNNKAVQLLEKPIVEKLDNGKYLSNKDGGTSPRNQVHEAFLYPDFEISLRSKCTINLDYPLLIKHYNETRLLA